MFNKTYKNKIKKDACTQFDKLCQLVYKLDLYRAN